LHQVGYWLSFQQYEVFVKIQFFPSTSRRETEVENLGRAATVSSFFIVTIKQKTKLMQTILPCYIR